MSVKTFSILLSLFFLSILFFGCGKKKNSGLGTQYYKISSFELEGDGGDGGDGGVCNVNYRKSLQYIEKALAEEEKPEYLAQKGTILFLLRRESDSNNCFERALKVAKRPSIRAEILNNYACLIAKRGATARALRLFESLENDKDYLTPEVAMVNQAKIYYEDMDYLSAKNKLIGAIKFAPDYVDAYYYLALVCKDMGDRKLGLWAAREVLRVEESHEGAIILEQELAHRIL